MINNLKPKPYKLFNTIQHYDWGTKNTNAFIPQLIGTDALTDKPYAELWIGAHPKAPSEIRIENQSYRLNDVIEKFPSEILGQSVAEKFDNKLPFLLKILTADKALSIQTHPNKEQAEILHKKDPINYPDDNHKPEIAIAIDKLTAIAGFRPVNEIIDILINNNEFRDFVGATIYDDIVKGIGIDLEAKIKLLYKTIMDKGSDKQNLGDFINKLKMKFAIKNNLDDVEKQFLEQYKLYGNDIGLISFFLFNLIELKPRQAIFTDAGIPHAYINGNIIECMANSDNVVRAGLTNKFKDIDVLLEVLNYQFDHYKIINEKQESDEVNYKTEAEEFEITLLNKNKEFTKQYNTYSKPIVYLIISGSMEVKYGPQSESEIFEKGESFLIPAFLNSYNILIKERAEFIQVNVP